MTKKPELLIDYGLNSRPISAACSVCGQKMPLMESKEASSEESIKWFSIQFDLHLRREHHREDVNQAAARVVREATEKTE